MKLKEKEKKHRDIRKWEASLIRIANIYKFIIRVLKETFTPPFEVGETLRQCYIMGNRTLLLIGFTSFLAGIVFTRQSRPSLAEFGAESWLPSLVSIALVRGLGPLITALICSGKLGSSMGAELSSMKVTEQIDAMEASGTNPFRYLVVTRVLATTLMVPVLVMYADTVGLLGSYIAVHYYSQTTFKLFFTQAFEALSFLDIFSTVVKPFFFGFAIGIVSSYAGYNAPRATVGVGKAANQAVVISMVCVFIIDFLSVQIFGSIR